MSLQAVRKGKKSRAPFPAFIPGGTLAEKDALGGYHSELLPFKQWACH